MTKTCELFDNVQYDLKDKNKNIINYVRYMLLRTSQMFEYKNLPDTIPANMLELYLQMAGVACITLVDDKLYVFTGGWGGEPDVYYRPTRFVVTNPALKFNKDLKLGEEAVLIYNDSRYVGLRPLYERYATALAENDITMNIADIMSRVNAIMVAGDDRTKQSAEKYLKDVVNGSIGVIGDNTVLESFKTQPYMDAAHNSITDLIELHQYLKASWFNEIGLSANYNMKREAINSSEAQLGEDSLLPLIDDMLHARQEWVAQVNKLYGTNIEVNYHSAWNHVEKEAEDDQITEDTPGSEGEISEAPPVESVEPTEPTEPTEPEVNQEVKEEASEDTIIEVPVSDEDVKEAGGEDDGISEN